MDNPLKKIIQTMLLTAMPFTGQATAATLAPETSATNPGLFSQLAVEAGITILALACMLLVHQLWRFYQRAQRREAEVRQQIWRQANYDYLTQLPNRYLLQDCLEKSIQECQQSQ